MNRALTDAIASHQMEHLVNPGLIADQILPPVDDPIENPPDYHDPRQTVFGPDELANVPTDAFVKGTSDGGVEVLYRPASAKHFSFHASSIAKLIMEGSRGTGKSHTMRWDAHMRAMSYPGFHYLMMRRTMPELRKSHLLFLDDDMTKLGGRALGVRSGNVEAHYPNSSIGLFGHCETDADVMKYLSAQFDAIYFDEITTFDWDMVTKISTSCRVKKGSGLTAIVRGGTNPLGCSAEEVYRYFIARDITPQEEPKYNPADWGNLHIERDDSPHLDYEQYDKQFVGLSEAYRKAWMDGVWGVEGAYFSIEARHYTDAMPKILGINPLQPPKPATEWNWVHVYCVLDWGWHDPCVCIWIALLPDGRAIPFMEYSTIRTPAKQVARELKERSQGLKVITTIADPTLWDGEKEMGHCLADEFEAEGVFLTKGKNDRTAAGYAIQEWLNQTIQIGDETWQRLTFIQRQLEDGRTVESPTPTLIKALKAMRVDKTKPGRIADHKADHMPIALGYFCQASPAPGRRPVESTDRPWLKKSTAVGTFAKLGAKQVRKLRSVH